MNAKDKKHNGHPKRETRINSILLAAESILIENGYHNFSMRLVASKSGISIGNLQYYFSSKADLIESLFDRVIQEYLNLYDEMRHKGSPKEQFCHIVEHVFTDLNTKRTTLFFPEVWSLSNHEIIVTRLMDDMYEKYRLILSEVIHEINPALSAKQTKRLSIFISSSIEGHTMFIGYQKPWKQESKNMIKMAIQSFLWLIEQGDIPK